MMYHQMTRSRSCWIVDYHMGLRCWQGIVEALKTQLSTRDPSTVPVAGWWSCVPVSGSVAYDERRGPLAGGSRPASVGFELLPIGGYGWRSVGGPGWWCKCRTGNRSGTVARAPGSSSRTGSASAAVVGQPRLPVASSAPKNILPSNLTVYRTCWACCVRFMTSRSNVVKTSISSFFPMEPSIPPISPDRLFGVYRFWL